MLGQLAIKIWWAQKLRAKFKKRVTRSHNRLITFHKSEKVRLCKSIAIPKGYSGALRILTKLLKAVFVYLAYFFPVSPFFPKVFWYFQEESKRKIGKKRIKTRSSSIWVITLKLVTPFIGLILTETKIWNL